MTDFAFIFYFLVQEPVMIKFLEEVPHLLASYARPANTSCYPSWTCFLEHFLREGKFAKFLKLIRIDTFSFSLYILTFQHLFLITQQTNLGSGNVSF